MSNEKIFGSAICNTAECFSILLILLPVIVKIDIMRTTYKDNLFRKAVFGQYNKNIKIY